MAGALSTLHHKAEAGAPPSGAHATPPIIEAAPPAPQAPIPWDVDDLYALDALEDPRCSPSGLHVAFVRVSADRVENRYHRAIWLAATDGTTPPRRFTSGIRSDTAPRWSPDGQWLAFVSDRAGGPPQLYLMRTDGGEARCLTTLPGGVSEPAWRPDGTQLAFLSRANADERAAEDRGECPPAPASAWERERAIAARAHAEAARFDPRIVTRLPYRAGTSFFDDRRMHVYVLDIPADDDAPPGQPRRLSDGDMHHGAPAWMPDGSAILTTATRDPEADAIFAFYDILRLPVPPSGRGEAERLSEAGFSYYDPQPSPDGAWIALRRRADDRPLAAGAHIAVMPASGGALRDISGGADLNAEALRWQPDGAGVLFTANWRGTQPLYCAHLEKNAGGTATPDASNETMAQSIPPPLIPAADRFIEAFDPAPDGGIAFVAGSGTSPCELFFRHADERETQLTHFNRALLAGRATVSFQELLYHAPDGQEVQGWLLYPPGFDPAQQYPLAVHIHGGPHYMWAPGFRHMWHELQATAGRGYVVFFCNPRGSEGYGECWRDAIHANWGFADAPDILAGIDAVIALGGIDPARIGVTGGSYGGYMTAWLLAHTDRFACGVSARGVYNLLTQHSTSDAHELIEYEFDGYPWDMAEKLWKHSPLAYAHQINAPLRLLHSEHDYRVPISEAEQMFALLRRRRQVVELVRYPREGHELTRGGEPAHRADHMARTLEWLDRYCKPDSEH